MNEHFSGWKRMDLFFYDPKQAKKRSANPFSFDIYFSGKRLPCKKAENR